MKINCAHDEIVPLSKLVPNPKNPNVHPKSQIERLAQIIEFQGQRSPIVVSNRSGFITKGHGRLAAITLLGWDAAAVDYQDYESEAQEWADIVADNAIALWAELDQKLISEESLKFPDLKIELLGMENFTLITPELLPKGDPNEFTDVKQPITEKGDVWRLGRHRLMCGDSTDPEQVLRLLDGAKAQLVFTDPPYNQETTGGEVGPIGGALRKQGKEIEHLCSFEPEDFLNTLPVCFDKNKMNALIFCNKDLVPRYLSWGVAAGYSFNILFWKKPTAIPIGGSYRPDVEYLLVFRRSGTFNGDVKEASYSKCLEHKREADKVHPTMKPVELIENQLLICSNKDGAVVDLFSGSGSTIIAADRCGRVGYGMELDPKYCDVSIVRWQKLTGSVAILESNGKTYEEMVEERKKAAT